MLPFLAAGLKLKGNKGKLSITPRAGPETKSMGYSFNGITVI